MDNRPVRETPGLGEFHSERVGQLTGLAVGACRDGAPVAGIHAAIDQALAGYRGDESFAAGIIARRAAADRG